MTSYVLCKTGSLAVFKVTARDQGHYKGPSGAFVTYCNISCYFYLSKKIRLDVSSESSARQRIHFKHQVLFSLKSNEKIFMNVVCCSRDWRFKG